MFSIAEGLKRGHINTYNFIKQKSLSILLTFFQASLYEIWREMFFTNIFTQFKLFRISTPKFSSTSEGHVLSFGSGASLYLQKLHEGNLEGGLLH